MMLELYKFRPLEDGDSCSRAAEILETGYFWCSPLWEQNDPMEGVYTYLNRAGAAQQLDSIFTEKNRKRICSFSGAFALARPTMWGYYANGFKGIAIRIEIEQHKVRKVRYRSDTDAWSEDVCGETTESKVERLLTTKLTAWRTESEYRFLTNDASPRQKIGEITGVYFGEPYGGVENMHQVVDHSPKLQSYHDYRSGLISIAQRKGYDCFTSRIIRSAEGKWTVNHRDIPPTNP